MFRSQKEAHKQDKVKKDDEDQWTKDEREYLGPELFAILQERRKMLQETGEVEDEVLSASDANQSGPGKLAIKTDIKEQITEKSVKSGRSQKQ